MTRRGDATHTYRGLARELGCDLSPERRRRVERELGKLWWGLSDEERAEVPCIDLPKGVSGSELPPEALLGPAERAALRAETKAAPAEDEASETEAPAEPAP